MLSRPLPFENIPTSAWLGPRPIVSIYYFTTNEYTDRLGARIVSHDHSRPRAHRRAPIVNSVFAGVKGNLRWQRCIHRTPCRIYREIDTRTRQRSLYTRLPAPSRAWPTSPHVASGDARTALVCECAPIIWNSAITPPTYTAAASECVRREVIIIISCLIIVIRGDGTRCHRQINAARPDDARPARSTLPLLPFAIVLYRGESRFV